MLLSLDCLLTVLHCRLRRQRSMKTLLAVVPEVENNSDAVCRAPFNILRSDYVL